MIGLKMMAVLMKSHEARLKNFFSQVGVVQISAEIMKQLVLSTRAVA